MRPRAPNVAERRAQGAARSTTRSADLAGSDAEGDDEGGRKKKHASPFKALRSALSALFASGRVSRRSRAEPAAAAEAAEAAVPPVPVHNSSRAGDTSNRGHKHSPSPAVLRASAPEPLAALSSGPSPLCGPAAAAAVSVRARVGGDSKGSQADAAGAGTGTGTGTWSGEADYTPTPGSSAAGQGPGCYYGGGGGGGGGGVTAAEHLSELQVAPSPVPGPPGLHASGPQAAAQLAPPSDTLVMSLRSLLSGSGGGGRSGAASPVDLPSPGGLRQKRSTSGAFSAAAAAALSGGRKSGNGAPSCASPGQAGGGSSALGTAAAPLSPAAAAGGSSPGVRRPQRAVARSQVAPHNLQPSAVVETGAPSALLCVDAPSPCQQQDVSPCPSPGGMSPSAAAGRAGIPPGRPLPTGAPAAGAPGSHPRPVSGPIPLSLQACPASSSGAGGPPMFPSPLSRASGRTTLLSTDPALWSQSGEGPAPPSGSSAECAAQARSKSGALPTAQAPRRMLSRARGASIKEGWSEHGDAAAPPAATAPSGAAAAAATGGAATLAAAQAASAARRWLPLGLLGGKRASQQQSAIGAPAHPDSSDDDEPQRSNAVSSLRSIRRSLTFTNGVPADQGLERFMRERRAQQGSGGKSQSGSHRQDGFAVYHNPIHLVESGLFDVDGATGAALAGRSCQAAAAPGNSEPLACIAGPGVRSMKSGRAVGTSGTHNGGTLGTEGGALDRTQRSQHIRAAPFAAALGLLGGTSGGRVSTAGTPDRLRRVQTQVLIVEPPEEERSDPAGPWHASDSHAQRTEHGLLQRSPCMEDTSHRPPPWRRAYTDANLELPAGSAVRMSDTNVSPDVSVRSGNAYHPPPRGERSQRIRAAPFVAALELLAPASGADGTSSPRAHSTAGGHTSRRALKVPETAKPEPSMADLIAPFPHGDKDDQGVDVASNDVEAFVGSPDGLEPKRSLLGRGSKSMGVHWSLREPVVETSPAPPPGPFGRRYGTAAGDGEAPHVPMAHVTSGPTSEAGVHHGSCPGMPMGRHQRSPSLFQGAPRSFMDLPGLLAQAVAGRSTRAGSGPSRTDSSVSSAARASPLAAALGVLQQQQQQQQRSGSEVRRTHRLGSCPRPGGGFAAAAPPHTDKEGSAPGERRHVSGARSLAETSGNLGQVLTGPELGPTDPAKPEGAEDRVREWQAELVKQWASLHSGSNASTSSGEGDDAGLASRQTLAGNTGTVRLGSNSAAAGQPVMEPLLLPGGLPSVELSAKKA
ncbi:hypothetical protein HYH03_013791 [Edaphochlamys debaryana]|uniref:Uncharacterized protein n=1 Tax=Edaphochlamys debaryana TaxID=47281 RepID=A0A835XXT1_9CHLO|nr:hypothetical protein HYH03_013791 [Edaphochlamys debaryana]|eukprot:KAG2487654.1 hypothetical protein HYH03_013791 [Edaphochlamys debaryana]